MTADKQWYAVYTRSRWEKKVSDLLSKKRIENFCPLNRVLRQWADRKKTVYEPLFTCYVFVRISEKEQLLIKQTDGILNFVHWLGKPAVIKDEEIDMVKRFLNEHDDVKLEKINVNINDKVKIISGPLMQCEGEVLQIKNNTVKIHLPSLGYAIVAEVKKIDVEVIGQSPGNTNTYRYAAY
jgi:transcription antitermination factor NusG